MRNVILACAVAVAALTGCSGEQDPAVATAELDAEQQRAQKEVDGLERARQNHDAPETAHRRAVQDQERARHKNLQPEKSHQQSVQDQERARQKR